MMENKFKIIVSEDVISFVKLFNVMHAATHNNKLSNRLYWTDNYFRIDEDSNTIEIIYKDSILESFLKNGEENNSK